MVHFHGFTTAPIWFGHGASRFRGKPSLSRPPLDTPGMVSQPAWALVFEGPARSSLLFSLPNHLHGMTERRSWLTILTFLYEIGASVREIHRLFGRPYGFVFSSPLPFTRTHNKLTRDITASSPPTKSTSARAPLPPSPA